MERGGGWAGGGSQKRIAATTGVAIECASGEKVKSRYICAAAVLLLAAPLFAQQKAQLVEEIIARVNNDIITLTQYDRAQTDLRGEIRQDCPSCTPAQIEERYQEQSKDLLRDLIDQSLLVQKAKDDGIDVEADLVKALDRIRQQNNFATMEDFQKAVEASGLSWEDYRDSIRNRLLTQEVIRREVGSRIIVDNEEIRKYYDTHQQEFNRPEEVYLREIFVSTQGKSPAEIPALEKKAETLLQRVRNGESFSALAKAYSDGPTAKDGGDLGLFQKGQLAKQIEDAVFKLHRNETTKVIRTDQGFEILQVVEHYDAGIQPLDKIQNEVEDKIYQEKLKPALRGYLKQLREQSYVTVKPGYVDTAAVSSTPIEEVASGSSENKGTEKDKKHKGKKRG
jgi:peptidyl-prolyl cis-trans isomerase SurA